MFIYNNVLTLDEHLQLYINSTKIKDIEIDLLNQEEQERAQKLVFKTHRIKFIQAHVALQKILGALLKKKPPIDYLKNKNGKPYLPKLPFYFNLSHSGDFLIIAVSSTPIGVDIEMINPNRDYKKIAARFFSPKEKKSLKDFYQAWARREAMSKALGVDWLKLKKIPPNKSWVIYDLQIDKKYCAALAVPKSHLGKGARYV